MKLSAQDQFYCNWIRLSGHEVTGYKSPLPGFAGFCEENLNADSFEKRYEIVGRGLDVFFNKIPFGLPGLKVLAFFAPSQAAQVLQQAIPTTMGWMMGPTKNLGPGVVELSDCPYRKRLGNMPCESTCGSALGKYFTDKIKVPFRFDPTVDNYTKCHILIGKGHV